MADLSSGEHPSFCPPSDNVDSIDPVYQDEWDLYNHLTFEARVPRYLPWPSGEVTGGDEVDRSDGSEGEGEPKDEGDEERNVSFSTPSELPLGCRSVSFPSPSPVFTPDAFSSTFYNQSDTTSSDVFLPAWPLSPYTPGVQVDLTPGPAPFPSDSYNTSDLLPLEQPPLLRPFPGSPTSSRTLVERKPSLLSRRSSKKDKLDSPEAVRYLYFPVKVFKMLHDPRMERWVHWDQAGEIIVIPHEAEFIAHVMPEYCGSINFKSVLRQFSQYGFKRITKNAKRSTLPAYAAFFRDDTGPDNYSYHHLSHPYFQRDRPDLLDHITASVARGVKGATATKPVKFALTTKTRSLSKEEEKMKAIEKRCSRLVDALSSMVQEYPDFADRHLRDLHPGDLDKSNDDGPPQSPATLKKQGGKIRKRKHAS